MCCQQDYSNINIHTLLLKQNLVFSSKQVHYELILTVSYRKKNYQFISWSRKTEI